MPRISPRLVREALSHSHLLPPLLRANPNLSQAKQELQWIKNELPRSQWRNAINRRANLEPLQYILKSQPFGSLDIECRPGVLIPRWETEEWSLRLADLIKENYNQKDLTIVDACTGSGCIPLLLNEKLNGSEKLMTRIVGFDVSPEAWKLSNDNLIKIDSRNRLVKFKQLDLFSDSLVEDLGLESIDILVSNPPYIPMNDYNSSMLMNGVEKSVRLYEPALALIGENEFYGALIRNIVLPSKVKAFVFELGYESQVEYVKKALDGQDWSTSSYYDSSGKIRCVVGWEEDMAFFEKFGI